MSTAHTVRLVLRARLHVVQRTSAFASSAARRTHTPLFQALFILVLLVTLRSLWRGRLNCYSGCARALGVAVAVGFAHDILTTRIPSPCLKHCHCNTACYISHITSLIHNIHIHALRHARTVFFSSAPTVQLSRQRKTAASTWCLGSWILISPVCLNGVGGSLFRKFSASHNRCLLGFTTFSVTRSCIVT